MLLPFFQLSYDVTTLNTPKLIVGSSPYFDDCTNSLYFSDAYGQKYSIFRYDFKEEVCYYAEIPGETSAGSITPIKGSRTRFIVGVGGGFKIIKWNGISKLVKVIETIDARRNKNSPANIMVDSMVDMTGRLYNGDQTPAVCDFSQPANASLYTYKKGEGVVKRLHHLRLANAPTFNQKEKKCYFTDACAFDIKEFEWDPDTGDLRMLFVLEKIIDFIFKNSFYVFLGNGRRVFDFRKHGRLPPYLPNGITIDLDGNLYEPLYNKGQIFKIDPR